MLVQSEFGSAQGDGPRKGGADVHGGRGWMPGLRLSADV